LVMTGPQVRILQAAPFIYILLENFMGEK